MERELCFVQGSFNGTKSPKSKLLEIQIFEFTKMEMDCVLEIKYKGRKYIVLIARIDRWFKEIKFCGEIAERERRVLKRE